MVHYNYWSTQYKAVCLLFERLACVAVLFKNNPEFFYARESVSFQEADGEKPMIRWVWLD